MELELWSDGTREMEWWSVAASGEAEPNDLISVLDGTSFRGTNPINVAEDFSG